MLVRLSVQNLAVVEQADVRFGAGLNVITGETGAGKSVLMGALHLIAGDRADRTLIRTGAPEATVCAVYELADPAAADAVLAEADLPPCDEGSLIIRRTITAAGTGRIRVNDAPATTGLLKRLAPFLTDIHGPNDNLSLLNSDFQLRLLTAYAGAEPELAVYQHRWDTLRDLEAQLRELTGDPGERETELRRISDELAEFETAAVSEADGDDLLARHAAAANAGEILSIGTALTDRLTDGENPISEQLMELHRALRSLSPLLPEASEWSHELSGAQIQLRELSHAITLRLSQIDADPGALEQLENRLALVQRLKRKYACPDIPSLLHYRDDLRDRFDALQAAGGDILQLTRSVEAAREAVTAAAEALRNKRRAGLSRLSRAITAELRDLGFAQASFPIALDAVAQTRTGADAVTFQFEPNPGEAVRPLAAIASSGEIARVMLAVKTILARHDAIPTLIFDEIDANIGGETAKCVGEKLHTLSSDAQVICITHQPQAARFGDCHFRVQKRVAGDRTLTQIDRLDADTRIDELARMLGGGDAARRHAEVLCTSPLRDAP